jgi:phosphatidylserine/phosphatidylglycerophosphate/cardiolipin synthase-like enzyme
VSVTDWFLTAAERGNEFTVLDARQRDGGDARGGDGGDGGVGGHAHGGDGGVGGVGGHAHGVGGQAWSSGNEATPLVHGATYFAELRRCVEQLRAGDLVLFTDWRGDPDELVAEGGPNVSQLLSQAAMRGVIVKGLIWRSHLDRFAFSEQENRHLGEDIEAAGGECLLDMRVRPGGSHHQKFVVLRHPGRPELDVAFVGGIDLCHSRRDDAWHNGDPQSQPMAKAYGPRPPWHDVQLAVRGPAVADVETVFRERWNDPTPLSRNPIYRLSALLRRTDTTPGPLPEQLPPPAARGSRSVQLLRTYPYRWHGYPFAPNGERSVARAYNKVVSRANALIYLEDQYLWSSEIVACFARALIDRPTLHLIAVLPHHPDQDGRLTLPLNLVGRQQAIRDLLAAGGDRVAFYGIENHAGTPTYVHAKVCVIDDVWASVGSDNVNRRSWTHDSELSCAVIDDARDARDPQALDRFGHGARAFARNLRLELAREHLDRAHTDDGDLIDPVQMFDAFARSATDLQQWVERGRSGPRPPGRLRPYVHPNLSRPTRMWATPLYRVLADPDGRPAKLRRRHAF